MRSWKDIRFSDYILKKTGEHDEEFKKNMEYYSFGKKDFEDNVKDLHHTFYSKIQKPEDEQDEFFVGFIKIIDETNEFLDLKDKCSNNAALSFIAAREFTGKMYEEYLKVMEEKQKPENQNEDGSGCKPGTVSDFLEKNKDRIRQESKGILKRVVEKVEEGEAVEEFMNGCGDEESVNDKLEHSKKVLEFAKKLSQNRWFKEIMKMAGQFKRAANNKLTRDIPNIGCPVGVDIGNDLSKILPQELAVMELGNGHEDLFWLKWANGELMQYKTTAKETIDEGAFIVCLDESGSMGYEIAKAKAFMFGMFLIAKARNRKMHVVRFDTRSIGHKIEKVDDMISIVDQFMGGGTDFNSPLLYATNLIETNQEWKKADVFFITDGESSVEPEVLEKIKELKGRIDFKILSLALTGCTKELRKFSDVIFNARESEKFYAECFDQ